ncbi:MAG: NAD(P)/FAD-dependent oxidoreductase [Candidatus Nanopelagicaceae bacterium]|nr:NAD(P)/FAD-dependent oxidoreductase [Candidatus Nanopelagicaceae bacterium]
MNQDYEVAIVGGGHNALVAACYLAKAGKKVIVLEKNQEFGGATKSVYAFEGVGAKLSRYSYLVALLPDQIKQDLDLKFETLSRTVSSYTPSGNTGILINRNFDAESSESITAFTSSNEDSDAWERFYKRIGVVAERLAPTMLEPLKDEVEIKALIGDELWDEFVVQPLEVTLNKYFKNDLVKGIVLTDGLIGTFASAAEILSNICFHYHLVGNGTGEWRVPKGGMGKLVEALLERTKSLGVDLRAGTEVISAETTNDGVMLRLGSGEDLSARVLLSGAAPRVLERLTGIKAPNFRDGSQVKMNMVLKRLPKLKSGLDPKKAFAGTFHIDESFEQLEKAYHQAKSGVIPDVIPSEMYCHTLTDPSILSESMQAAGNHTLTLFALHTPASLFDIDHEKIKVEVFRRILAGLNKYLAEPIEDLILDDAAGKPCIEVKTPQELEAEIDLPRGNIFHSDLMWPWRTQSEQGKWGVETTNDRVFIAGAGAIRGGGVSGIAGHNAAMATLERLAKSN